MKIAFVGKGGSGKTTVSSLFTQHVSHIQPVLGIDADINMHMAELYAVKPTKDMLISEKLPSKKLKEYLKGSNVRIKSLDHFKKSTPPGTGSRLINVTHSDDWFMSNFTCGISDTLRLAVVGTYSEDGIASSCYHNNLAILENTLSHTTDAGLIVVDMVAGTDAFASTLFAQFDALFFVAEPTTRSLAVYEQYEKLAQKGGVVERLFVVGNKIDADDDIAFIKDVVGDKLVANLSRSQHIAMVDKGRTALDASRLEESDLAALDTVKNIADTHAMSAQERLPILWRLHEKYVGQGYIKERFGDITDQIDKSFVYPQS